MKCNTNVFKNMFNSFLKREKYDNKKEKYPDNKKEKYPDNIICNEVLHKEENILLFITTVDNLYSKYNIQNWSKNRPPDEVRVTQIKESYANENTRVIDGTISAWENGDILFIYDGIHRLMAANPEMKVICKILVNCNENKTIEDFKRINSSVSLPWLYLEEDNELKIKVCNSVINKMCEKFKNCISPSRNPWKCNFNRDIFIENVLSKLQIDFQLKNIDKIIFDVILGINEKSKNFVNENNIDHYKKCKINNFFLMYLSFDTIKTNIENSCFLI